MVCFVLLLNRKLIIQVGDKNIVKYNEVSNHFIEASIFTHVFMIAKALFYIVLLILSSQYVLIVLGILNVLGVVGYLKH
jgi:hypothetical protein